MNSILLVYFLSALWRTTVRHLLSCPISSELKAFLKLYQMVHFKNQSNPKFDLVEVDN